MSNEIAIIPSKEELDVYQVMAKTAQSSKRFDALGGEAGILSIMLMARELGLPPMQAISGGINVIQGRVEISPRMMNTMIRKAGHILEILKSDNSICQIKGIRRDTKEEYIASFSIEDARGAGLIRAGGPWEKYASDMLFARTLSRLARRLFADVISTAYAEGEIEDQPERAQKQPIVPQLDPIEAKAEIVDSKPEEADLGAFIREMQVIDGTFYGVKLDEYLKTISVKKKSGETIPISTVIKQALKMPDRFLDSYWMWYNNQEEKS